MLTRRARAYGSSCSQVISLAEFDGPTPKTLYRLIEDLEDISNRSRVIAHFVPNFVDMVTRESPGVNLNDTVILAIPENHTLEPKITTLSYTQPKL